MDADLAAPCDTWTGQRGKLHGLVVATQSVYEVLTLKELSAALGVSVAGLAINLTTLLFAGSLFAMFAEARRNARNFTVWNFLVDPATRIATYFAVVMAITILSGYGGHVIWGKSAPIPGAGGTLAASLPDAGMQTARGLLSNQYVTNQMATRWNITPVPVPTNAGDIAGYGACAAVKGVIFPLDMGGRVSAATFFKGGGWLATLVDLIVSVFFFILTIVPLAAQIIAFVILFFERIVLGVNGSIIASLGIIALAALVWDKSKTYGQTYFNALLNLWVSGLVLGVFLWITLNLQLLAQAQMQAQMNAIGSLNFADGAIWAAITWIFGALILAFAFSTGVAAQQILTGQLGMSTASMLSGLAAVGGLVAGAGAVAKSFFSRNKKDAVAPADTDDKDDATTSTPTPGSGGSGGGPPTTSSPPSSAPEAGSPPQGPREVPPDGAGPGRGEEPPATEAGPPTTESGGPTTPSGRPTPPSASPPESAAGPDTPSSGEDQEGTDSGKSDTWTPEVLAGVAASVGGLAGLRQKLQQRFAEGRKRIAGSHEAHMVRQGVRAVKGGLARAAAVGAAVSYPARLLGHHTAPFAAQMAHTVQAAAHGQHLHFGHTLGPNAPHRAPRTAPQQVAESDGGASVPAWTRQEALGAMQQSAPVLPPAHAHEVGASVSAGVRAADQGIAHEAAASFLAAAAITETAIPAIPGPEHVALQTSADRLRSAAGGAGAPRSTPTIARLSGTNSPQPRIARRNPQRLTPVQQQLRDAYEQTRGLQLTQSPTDLRAAAALDVALDAAMRGHDLGAVSGALNHARALTLRAGGAEGPNAAVWQQIAERLAPSAPPPPPPPHSTEDPILL